MLLVALKLALYDRVRFGITIAGVAFAVTLVLVQVGLLTGILANATVTIEHAKADLWVTSHNTTNIDFAHAFPDSYVQRVRGVEGVADAANLIVFYSTIALPNGAEETVLTYGLPADTAQWGLPWSFEGGQLASLRAGRAMFLDESATRRFGAFAIGDYREVGGLRMQIVGMTEGAKSFTTVPIAFFDFHTLQEVMPELMSGRTTFILIKLKPGANAEVAAAEVRKRLPYNDVFTKEQWIARTRNYWLESTGLGMNMYVTVFLGCLIGLVVVAQTLYASTMDYIKEFGTLKAIGSTNAEIYSILGWQSLVAAVLGFGTGLVPSFFARYALGRFAALEVNITLPFLVIVFAGTLTMCMLASLVSFRKIASIDPALVFRG